MENKISKPGNNFKQIGSIKWMVFVVIMTINVSFFEFVYAEDDYPCYPCNVSMGATTTTGYITPTFDKRFPAPAISPPADTLVAPNDLQCRAVVNLDTPEVNIPGFCAIPVINITNDAPAYFHLGTTIVHWTFTNIYNRSTVVNQNVIVAGNLQLNTFSTNPACFGSNNGSVQAIPAGGTPPYAFLWNNNQTTQGIGGLSQGVYSVTVTDANGCTSTGASTLSEPNLLSVSAQVISNVSVCGGSDGSALANVAGGTPAVQLTWSDNLSQSGSMAVNLAAGSYTVTAVDANGCSSASTIQITQGVAELCGNLTDDDCDGSIDEGCEVTLNLKSYVEGYYLGFGNMVALLYDLGLSSDPTACDSITVELHNSFSPYALVESKNVLLHINGTASAAFSYQVFNQSYYIVVRHRNTIETWSKNPVLFDAQTKNFDFTSQ